MFFRYAKAFGFYATKENLVSNAGFDEAAAMEVCKVSEKDLEEARECRLEIIDGYHRYGALMIIRHNPERLLTKDIGIDWKQMAERYPTWITMDRSAVLPLS